MRTSAPRNLVEISAVSSAMRHALLPLCLLLACSSPPDSGDSGGGETASTSSEESEGSSGASSSDGESEGGSSSGGVDLSCLESTPVMEASCGVLWIVVGSGATDPESTDHNLACDWGDGWSTSDVVAEIYNWECETYGENAGTCGQPITWPTAGLECGGDPYAWTWSDPWVPGIVGARLTWVTTWGDDDLVYRCSKDLGFINGGGAIQIGSEVVVGFPHAGPPLNVDGECCLVSGTPTADYPSDPCE